MIEQGTLGLPELQRPFVWTKTRVRDLLDSLYRGYPIGTFVFWKNPVARAKHIGVGGHQTSPEITILDGQQRLTSFYAVLTGKPIIDESWQPQTIEIAFNPLTRAFAVTDAAIRKDVPWITNITDLYRASGDFAFINADLRRLSERKSLRLSDAERDRAAASITRLKGLTGTHFQAIILSEKMEAEEAARIFVRINSTGVELNEADFILTLMSVHWDTGRRELEEFSRKSKVPGLSVSSPFNPFIQPGPDQLLRMVVVFGLRRGRMRDGYAILRGRDLEFGRVHCTCAGQEL